MAAPAPPKTAISIPFSQEGFTSLLEEIEDASNINQIIEKVSAFIQQFPLFDTLPYTGKARSSGAKLYQFLWIGKKQRWLANNDAASIRVIRETHLPPHFQHEVIALIKDLPCRSAINNPFLPLKLTLGSLKPSSPIEDKEEPEQQKEKLEGFFCTKDAAGLLQYMDSYCKSKRHLATLLAKWNVLGEKHKDTPIGDTLKQFCGFLKGSENLDNGPDMCKEIIQKLAALDPSLTLAQKIAILSSVIKGSTFGLRYARFLGIQETFMRAQSSKIPLVMPLHILRFIPEDNESVEFIDGLHHCAAAFSMRFRPEHRSELSAFYESILSSTIDKAATLSSAQLITGKECLRSSPSDKRAATYILLSWEAYHPESDGEWAVYLDKIKKIVERLPPAERMMFFFLLSVVHKLIKEGKISLKSSPLEVLSKHIGDAPSLSKAQRIVEDIFILGEDKEEAPAPPAPQKYNMALYEKLRAKFENSLGNVVRKAAGLPPGNAADSSASSVESRKFLQLLERLPLSMRSSVLSSFLDGINSGNIPVVNFCLQFEEFITLVTSVRFRQQSPKEVFSIWRQRKHYIHTHFAHFIKEYVSEEEALFLVELAPACIDQDVEDYTRTDAWFKAFSFLLEGLAPQERFPIGKDVIIYFIRQPFMKNFEALFDCIKDVYQVRNYFSRKLRDGIRDFLGVSKAFDYRFPSKSRKTCIKKLHARHEHSSDFQLIPLLLKSSPVPLLMDAQQVLDLWARWGKTDERARIYIKKCLTAYFKNRYAGQMLAFMFVDLPLVAKKTPEEQVRLLHAFLDYLKASSSSPPHSFSVVAHHLSQFSLQGKAQHRDLQLA